MEREMRKALRRAALAGVLFVFTGAVFTGVSAQADVTIGQFTGGVAEPGWGRFSNGVQPLNSQAVEVA